MIDFISLIAKLGNPKNVILMVKVIREIGEAIHAILQLISTLSNGNTSEELQAELRRTNSTLTKRG